MKLLLLFLAIIVLHRSLNAQHIRLRPQSSPWTIAYHQPSQLFRGIAFPETDTGWIGGGLNLITTIDAGKHWTTLVSPGVIFDLCFTSTRDGYFTSNNKLFRTIDGAQSWSALSPGVSGMEGIAFLNHDTGFVVGLQSILRTSNAGASWAASPVACNFHRVSFANSRTGYAVGGMVRCAVNPSADQAGGCFKTTDGGASWHQCCTGVPSDLWSVFALNDSTVIAGATEGWICRSTDGGITWDNKQITPDEGIFAIDFTTPLRGTFVGGGGGIFQTIDAGHSWTQIESPCVPNFFCVKTLGDSSMVIAGDSGYVLHSIAGGQSAVAGNIAVASKAEVYPNPSCNAVRLRYWLSVSGRVSITISSASGVEIWTNSPGNQQAGWNEIEIPIGSLADGSYHFWIGSDSALSSMEFARRFCTGSFNVLHR